MNSGQLNKGVVSISARKIVEKELTRQRIVDAARELFVRNGYEQLSIRQIANLLGYSHGAIYYHFRNKSELLHEVMKHDFASLEKQINEVAETPFSSPQEQAQALCLSFIQFAFNNKTRYLMMFQTKWKDDPSIAGISNNCYALFSSQIQALFPNRANVHMVFSLYLSLEGFILHFIQTDLSYKAVEGFAKRHIAFLLKDVT